MRIVVQDSRGCACPDHDNGRRSARRNHEPPLLRLAHSLPKHRPRPPETSPTAFTAASVRTDIAALKSTNATFQATSPAPVSLPAGPAFKVSYSTESAPDPVTNKRVTLAVDRYDLSKSGKRAIVDLGAPKGVDNVDAFRMICRSFRWR